MLSAAVNTLLTTTMGLIDLQRAGGVGPYTYGPRGASERPLSAWSVQINTPSSWVMINANPIGCVSDENPVSQNEVGIGFPRRSLSRHTTQAARRGGAQSSAAWMDEVLQAVGFRDVWGVSNARPAAAARAGVDLPTSPSRAPGGGPHGPAWQSSGLFAGSTGGLTFPGHRSKVTKTLPEGRPLFQLNKTLRWSDRITPLKLFWETLCLLPQITAPPPSPGHENSGIADASGVRRARSYIRDWNVTIDFVSGVPRYTNQ